MNTIAVVTLFQIHIEIQHILLSNILALIELI